MKKWYKDILNFMRV